MTVGELINWLKDFDGDAEIVVAEYVRRGCNFAHDVGEVEEGRYDDWDDEDGEEPKGCVQIILGSRIGTMCEE